jgi:hypothetical protein
VLDCAALHASLSQRGCVWMVKEARRGKTAAISIWRGRLDSLWLRTTRSDVLMPQEAADCIREVVSACAGERYINK